MADIWSGFPETLTSMVTLRRPLAQARACWVGPVAGAALAPHLACGGGSSSLAPTSPSGPSRSFLAPLKPFAVAETAWPAEDVTAPYPVFIPASDEAQRLYVERRSPKRTASPPSSSPGSSPATTIARPRTR